MIDSTPSQTADVDAAFTPYGEHYAENNYLGYFGGNLSIYPFFMDGYASTWRLYHYDQGRWISPDPAGLSAVDPSNPQTWNRYAYVAGNPLSRVDPSGQYLVVMGGCYYNGVDYLVDGQYQGTDYTLLSCDASSPLVQSAGGGGGGRKLKPSSKTACFVQGLKSGAVGAVAVAGVTAVAGLVLAPEVVTGALLAGAAYGLVQTGLSVYNNYQSHNQAGLAYNAGSVVGGLFGGGVTSFGARFAITGETNLPTSIGDFFGKGKGIDFGRPGQSPFAAIRAAFSKGPDLGGGAGAIGLGGAGTASGCH